MDKKKTGKLNKLEWYWVIYDVGNSAFTLVASALFAIFFQNLVNTHFASIGSTLSSSAIVSLGDSWYAYATAAITLLCVIFEPLFGTMSDYKGTRKVLFLAFTLTSIVGCIVLGLPMNYILWLVILCVTKVLYNGALMIYDSMLVDVTDTSKMDKVSSFGYAFGYIGSCIPFLIGVAVVALGFRTYGGYVPKDLMDGISHSLTVSWGYLICFAINALWWLAFTLPLFFTYKQRFGLERKGKVGTKVLDSYKRIGHTIKNASKRPGVLLFLIAFFLYIDGVYSIIDLAMKISTSLGVDQVQALIALISVQFIAFPACLVFAKLSKHYRTDHLILACIIGYLFITVFAVFISASWMFWLLAVCVGLFQGGIQAMSRSYLAQIINKEESGEYFSLFDTFGKGASLIGTLLFGVINDATHDANMAIIPLSILVFLGGIFFVFSMHYNKKYFLKNRLDQLEAQEVVSPIFDSNHFIDVSRCILEQMKNKDVTFYQAKEAMINVAKLLLLNDAKVVEEYGFKNAEEARINGEKIIRDVNQIQSLKDLY